MYDKHLLFTEEHAHFFDILHILSKNPEVAAIITRLRAAKIPWSTIIAVLLQFLPALLSGGTVDWQAIIAALLALLNRPHVN